MAGNNNSQNALSILHQQMGQLSPAMQARLAALKQQGRPADELGAGITSGFAVVSMRGKVWRIKHRGDERPLVNERGEPLPSLEVVIVKGADAISKIFYEHGYAEGSTAPPDCWSTDGRLPDPAAPALKAGKTGPTCAGCWANAWGSRINNTSGSKGKACADSKRLAIVAAGNVRNEAYGGPMLFRVPPASLGNLKAYSDLLNQMGLVPYAVKTKLSFDLNAEYQLVKFEPVGYLNEDDFAIVEEMRSSPIMERMLSQPIEIVNTDGQDASHALPPPPRHAQQQAPQQAPAAPAQGAVFGAPTPQEAPQQAREPAPELQPEPVTPEVKTVPEHWVPIPGQEGVYFDPTTRAMVNANGEIIGSGLVREPKRRGKKAEAAAPQQAAPIPAPEPALEQAQPTPQEAKADNVSDLPVDLDNWLDGMLGKN